MTWDSLRTPNRRWGLCLVVSGLNVRYYDIVSPPLLTVIDGATAVSIGDPGVYVNRPGLLDVTGISDSYSVEGGIAEHASHTITLATRGRFAEDEYDPGVVFGRLTNRSATWTSRVTASLTQTSTTEVVFEDDPTSLSVPLFIHIDGETIWATGVSNTPYNRFTGITRGAARSPQQAHSVDTVYVDYPEVTTEVVHWRTRWATVYATPIYDDGSNGDWVELVHGFIDSTPEIDTDGQTVTIQLAPLTALLDTELAPPQDTTTTTRLLDGYHHFVYPDACWIEHAQRMRRGGPGMPRIVNTVSTAGFIPYAGANGMEWNNSLDWTRTPPHPRSGKIDTGIGGEHYITGATALGYNAPTVTVALNIGNGHVSEARELMGRPLTPATTTGSSATYRWPEEVAEFISGASGWTPLASVTGATGSWLNVRVDATAGKMSLTKNFTPDFPAVDFVWQSRRRRFFRDEPQPLDYNFSPPRASVASTRLHYPFVFPGVDNDPETEQNIVIQVTGESLDVDLDLPLSFYQRGERYILVEDDLSIPASGTLNLRLTLGDEIISFRAVSSSSVSYGGSTIGYALEIHEDDVGRLPSFGHWRGEASPEIVAVATWDSATSADVLTQLLASSGGNGVNGIPDLLPYGAALPGAFAPAYSVWGAAEFVDFTSFYQYPGPSSAENWSLSLRGGETLRDIVDSIARATSSLIVMQRRSDGSCRIRRVSVSSEGGYESAGAIAEGDWLADRVPTYGVDDRVYSRHLYRLNHDDAGENALEVTIIDNRALRTHGESQTYELDIRGLRLEDSGGDAPQLALRPIYSRISRILGDERRVWRGSVSTAQAALMQLGAVYSITSQFLRGYGDEIGVTAQAARLKSLTFGFTSEGADVEFVFFDANATGWNASLEITSIVSPTSVIVAANTYASTNSTSSGAAQGDLDYFNVGDTVRVLPTANHDAAVTLTISAINRTTRQVDFSGAHGIVAPLYGTVEPAVYTSAASQHVSLAYLADTTPKLGASDPAQEIS